MPISDDVQNFTETLVEEEFDELGIADEFDHDYVQDLFCIVLNKLPPHYVRHSVDVRINMTYEDRQTLAEKIRVCIADGQALLQSSRRQEERPD